MAKMLQTEKLPDEDIEKTIEAFVKAAERAYKAGFDGVELHGAYTDIYFISFSARLQIMENWTRGGSLENRSKLLLNILSNIKSVVPKSFMVGVRLSPEDKYGFQGIDLR
ncbi:MAG: hypothetical protein IPG99_19465 [Ignavibacteria bacterium]|nr:hypothetical protein [Ignavibacteria bacterium]